MRPLRHRPAFSTGPTGADRPPGSQATVSFGANSINGPARYWPARRSARQNGVDALHADARRQRRYGSRYRGLQCSACGSRSTATTCAAPSFKAANAQDAGAAAIVDHACGPRLAMNPVSADTARWWDACPCRTRVPGRAAPPWLADPRAPPRHVGKPTAGARSARISSPRARRVPRLGLATARTRAVCVTCGPKPASRVDRDSTPRRWILGTRRAPACRSTAVPRRAWVRARARRRDRRM